MTKRQENKLSMYRVVQKLLSDNNSIWSTTPSFVTTAAAFSAKITAINLASQQQQSVITGIAADKKKFKRLLLEATTPVAAGLVAYASQTNNNQLLEAVNTTPSKLNRTRDEQLIGRAETILEHANLHAAALLNFGVTPLHLNQFQTALNQYSAKTPATRTAIVSKSTATLNLAKLFTQTDTILRLQLDNLMLLFKKPQADFFINYKLARQIINLGTTHTSLSLTVKSRTGTLLPGAIVSLLQGSRVVYSKRTSPKGRVHIARISPGTYTLQIQNPGFVSATQHQITFIAGKRIKRTIQLSVLQ